ncbi:hypothetical protein [Williamsia sp.]|uniref:hypothetical protein n=1 Tax=Williamsia sp. TaxID=1872085 RepID=UPI002F91BFBB
MSEQHSGSTSAQSQSEPKKSLSERIPRRLFHGKVRTTTAVLVVLFLGALMLYGQRSDHYDTVDEQNRQARLSEVQQPRTTTPESEVPVPEPEYTETPETTTTEPSTTETTEPVDPTEQQETTSVPPPQSTSQSTRGGGFLPPWELPTISPAR